MWKTTLTIHRCSSQERTKKNVGNKTWLSIDFLGELESITPKRRAPSKRESFQPPLRRGSTCRKVFLKKEHNPPGTQKHKSHNYIVIWLFRNISLCNDRTYSSPPASKKGTLFRYLLRGGRFFYEMILKRNKKSSPRLEGDRHGNL